MLESAPFTEYRSEMTNHESFYPQFLVTRTPATSSDSEEVIRNRTTKYEMHIRIRTGCGSSRFRYTEDRWDNLKLQKIAKPSANRSEAK